MFKDNPGNLMRPCFQITSKKKPGVQFCDQNSCPACVTHIQSPAHLLKDAMLIRVLWEQGFPMHAPLIKNTSASLTRSLAQDAGCSSPTLGEIGLIGWWVRSSQLLT